MLSLTKEIIRFVLFFLHIIKAVKDFLLNCVVTMITLALKKPGLDAKNA